MALTSIGVEFAAAVGGFCLLGYWIDHHWQIERRWGLLTCAGLGLVGGLYNMVRQALKASAAPTQRRDGETRQPDGDA